MSDNNRTSIVVTVIISVVGVIGIFYLLMKISGYSGYGAMYMRGGCCCCSGGGSHGGATHTDSGNATRSGRPTTIVTAPASVAEPIIVKIEANAYQEVYFNSFVATSSTFVPRIVVTKISTVGDAPTPTESTTYGKIILNNPSSDVALYEIRVYSNSTDNFMFYRPYMATSNDLDVIYTRGPNVAASVSIH